MSHGVTHSVSHTPPYRAVPYRAVPGRSVYVETKRQSSPTYPPARDVLTIARSTMADRDEIQRIAAAMNALRPDWRVTSLVTFLTTHHASRPYRDLAIAAVSVATDPKTTTPNLLNEHGAWWVAAQTVRGESASSTALRPADPRCPIPGHEHELAHNCRICAADRMAALAPDDDADLTLSDAQAAANIRGAAAVRAQYTRPAWLTDTEGETER